MKRQEVLGEQKKYSTPILKALQRIFGPAWALIPRKGQVSLMAIGLGIVISGLLIFITGNNPFEAFWNLFRGGLMSPRRIGNTLANATNLALTGLAVAFAFRTGFIQYRRCRSNADWWSFGDCSWA
jgi:hypothetical protein